MIMSTPKIKIVSEALKDEVNRAVRILTTILLDCTVNVSVETDVGKLTVKRDGGIWKIFLTYNEGDQSVSRDLTTCSLDRIIKSIDKIPELIKTTMAESEKKIALTENAVSSLRSSLNQFYDPVISEQSEDGISQ